MIETITKLKVFAAATLFMHLLAAPAAGATTNPFALLVGKWGGNGLMTLDGNRKERLVCEAQYSGGAAQLVLSINCTGGQNKVDLRAKLSSNAGRLLGFWEERFFKVAGSISGVATESKMDFKVVGVVQGSMKVEYSKARQKVTITAQGVPLQTVTMNLTRR